MQISGDGQHHVLFFQPFRPQGAGVFTPVPGIDGDNDVAPGGLRDTLLDRGGLAGLVVEIQHQSVPGPFVGLQGETARVHYGAHVQHDPQVVPFPHAGADAADRGVVQFQALEAGFEAGIGNIHNDAAGVVQNDQFMFRGAGEIEDDSSVIGSAPQAHIVHFRSPGSGGCQ